MHLDFSKIRWQSLVVLAALLCAGLPAMAQTHVVNERDLQQQITAASQSRTQNLQHVQQFLSSPQAAKAFQEAHMNAQQVKTAVSALSDAELAHLASRAQQAQSSFAAGTLDDRDLIIIILAMVALILIIVAVR